MTSFATTQGRERTVIERHLQNLTVVGAVGAGLAGGVFFAFSTFVMPALRKLPASSAISAMQAINKAAPNPAFILVLFGTAAITLVLGVHGVRHTDAPGSVYLIIGGIAYLTAIVLTAAYHVPHNDALALVDPNAAGAAHTWKQYYDGWTLLNHVRTLGCAAGCVFLVLAARAV